MKQLFTNNAHGQLNAGITNVATTLTLKAGHGAFFPNPGVGEFFKFTMVDSSGNIEVGKCTQRTGDTFDTITRGEEGTTSRAFLANDKLELRATKETFENFQQKLAVASVTGNETLTKATFNTRKVVTATANITFPATTDVDIGDEVVIKSVTTGNVQLVPNGTDTFDGVNANYRVPSFSTIEVVKTAAGAWAILGRPEVEVGDIAPVARQTLPLGRLWCNAEDYSATTYAGLFAELVKSATVTFTAASPGKVNWTGHPLRNNDPVKFNSDGALPAALVIGTIYYARNKTANDYEVSATPGGASINFAGTGAGTHTGIYAPHGCATDLSTFKTPDYCGRAIVGRDDMGDIAAKGRITSAGSAVNGETLGAGGGAQNVTITTGQLPASGLSIPGLSIPSLSVSASGNLSHAVRTAGGVNNDRIAVTGTDVGGDIFTPTVSVGGSTGTGTTGGGTTGTMGSGGALNKLSPIGVSNMSIKT